MKKRSILISVTLTALVLLIVPVSVHAQTVSAVRGTGQFEEGVFFVVDNTGGTASIWKVIVTLVSDKNDRIKSVVESPNGWVAVGADPPNKFGTCCLFPNNVEWQTSSLVPGGPDPVSPGEIVGQPGTAPGSFVVSVKGMAPHSFTWELRGEFGDLIAGGSLTVP